MSKSHRYAPDNILFTSILQQKLFHVNTTTHVHTQRDNACTSGDEFSSQRRWFHRVVLWQYFDMISIKCHVTFYVTFLWYYVIRKKIITDSLKVDTDSLEIDTGSLGIDTDSRKFGTGSSIFDKNSVNFDTTSTKQTIFFPYNHLILIESIWYRFIRIWYRFIDIW